MADLPNDGDTNWGAPLRAYMEETRGIAGEASGDAADATTTAEEALALAQASIAPTDSAVATLVATPSSATATSLAATYRAGRAVPFNTRDFGALGDGVTDDTAALNAAFTAAAAVANSRVYVPAGTYKTTGTVYIATSCDATQATFNYSGTGTAVHAGAATSGATVARVYMGLPRVQCATRPSPLWDGTSVGIKVVNLNTCVIDVPFIMNFEIGLLMYGDNSGCAHNTVNLGALWQNHVNLWLNSNDIGFTNQNTFINGRLQQTLTGGVTDEDVNAYQIRLGNPTKRVNNNTFLGTSIEGDNPAYYRLWCHGISNDFYNCRWECYNDTQSRVWWNPGSSGNTIRGGYEAFKLSQNASSEVWSNTIDDNRGYFIFASKGTSQSIDSSTTHSTVAWETTSQRRAAKNAGGTAWTPEAGLWQINVSVGFAANATGYRGARILRGGSDTLDQVQVSSGADATIMKLATIARFDGTQTLTVQARQTSGGPLIIPTTDGYARLTAVRIGVEGPP